VRFGEFCLDRSGQRLLRHGQAVGLDPRAWQVLLYLVDHAGELVTKSQLFAAAWNDAAVSDAALSQALQRVRRALDDDARQARYVETVHRRGVRFIAAVLAEASEPPPVSRVAPVSAAEPALFVGRHIELRQLAEQLAAASRGTRQVVFIEGEAGMGKTALLNAFLVNHPCGEFRVATAQCIEQQEKAEPYMPVFEAFDRLARSSGVIELLRLHAPTWLAQMPWLSTPEEARRLGDTLTDTTRGRMLREMSRTVEVAAREVPLILVIEDLHWADPATLDLLVSLAQRSEPARLMILASYRPAQAIVDGHPAIELVRTLWAKRACTRLSLELLTPAEVREYLSLRFGAPDLVVSLGDQLHARSEGNPLFLEMIIDHLVERGLVAQGTSGWQLTKAVGSEELKDIPRNLRAMIEVQLDSVDAGGLEVLEAASVAAVRFRVASVAAGLNQPGPDGEEAVEHACERLVRRWHLLRAVGEQTWPDGTHTACYTFRHELYREVLYERLPASRRRRLHQLIGERIERAYGTRAAELEAVALAEHFEQGRDRHRAIQYRRHAGEIALGRGAYPEAAFHFRRALRLLVPNVRVVGNEASRGARLMNLRRDGIAEVKRLYAHVRRLSQSLGKITTVLFILSAQLGDLLAR